MGSQKDSANILVCNFSICEGAAHLTFPYSPHFFQAELNSPSPFSPELVSDPSLLPPDWSASVSPYVAPFVGSMLEAEKACRALVKKLEGDTDEDEEEEEDDEEGEDLCNVKFRSGPASFQGVCFA